LYFSISAKFLKKVIIFIRFQISFAFHSFNHSYHVIWSQKYSCCFLWNFIESLDTSIVFLSQKLKNKFVTSGAFKCSSLITNTSEYPYNLHFFDKLLEYQHDFLRQQNVQREVYLRCFCALFLCFGHRFDKIYYLNIFIFFCIVIYKLNNYQVL
jgi:hypothetical protein